MRIDPNQPAVETGASDRIGGGSADKSSRAANKEPAEDRVEVSDDLKRVQRIVADVVQDMATAPAVRQDVVDRARALLEADRVGRDSTALAEAIIKDLIDRP